MGQGRLSAPSGNRRSWVALLAWSGVLLGAGFAGWRVFRPGAEGRAPDPRPAGTEARDVEGFGGAVVALGLRARLARLHADPARQSFEARALRERLALADGEPWSLELVLDEGAASVVVVGPELRVVSASRAVLEPILRAGTVPHALSEPADRPADPLRTLLTPSVVELAAGGRATWVLWGRVDGAEPALRGLADGPLALAPARWTADGLEGVLARVTAPASEESGR